MLNETQRKAKEEARMLLGGFNASALRVYVADAHFPIAQHFKNHSTFEGFSVIVEVTGEIRASST